MCVYKINYIKVGTAMNYTIKRIDKNKAIMEMENGSRITLIFRDEDNPDIEDIVTNNLMMSYEQRIKGTNRENHLNKN